ncbi:serine/threonine-protein kinase [Paludisphaera mucosa]|uniref:Serine/threonine-protein kinase n=1 Tax=Paludisphaera mucosa TaxID=3030827 RepID=A0ABT6F7M2_9BACT|nr:serine/threonine-protein kinase [Paludisphaera mucosa]MDG3003524.1 serine/threonine-protein kinase [Paludisphaera mucosa]
MPESSSSRQLNGRFAFGSGDRPLDGYTIKRAVGRGGFGEVYYATSDSGKEVALKLILRNLDVERRGVVQCMNLKHPNLLTIFDLKTNDAGDAFVVMEYVAGPSLAHVLRQHPRGLPSDEVRHWLKGLTEGVAYLHDHGVVHRDLKPANLFMEEGTVKIGDYGLAKLITASHGSEHSESIGTCHYMAPEIGSGKYNKPIDIYAVGVILYEMLTGRVPFDGETVNEILMKHLTARADVSTLPAEYRGIVSRALAKDPNQRPAQIYDLLLPADTPRSPDIRIIGAKGVGEPPAGRPEDVHRIEAEEPVFYIGPDTLPPRTEPRLQDRLKADWKRMRGAAKRQGTRPPVRAAGFLREAPRVPEYVAPVAERPVPRPPEPPPETTGRARVAEVTASMLWAALMIGLLVPPAAALLDVDLAHDVPRIVFLYGTALLGTWASLGLNKFLEGRNVDAVGRRVAALIAGAAVGGGAFLLSQGLMLDQRSAGLAPIYFAALFGVASGWSGQAARDRTKRFRLAPIAWTLVLAGLVSPLWENHPAEGVALATIMVVVVQVVSPWSEQASLYTRYLRTLEKAQGRTRAA